MRVLGLPVGDAKEITPVTVQGATGTGGSADATAAA